MRKVLIIGHPHRKEARRVAAALSGLLSHGIQLHGSEEELKAFGLLGLPGAYARNEHDPGHGCELAVVLGGDGTILRACEQVRPSGIPLLGINLGHVGFLAEAEKEDVEHIVAGVVEKQWVEELRDTLEVEAILDGEVLHRDWALNEATVEKAERERMLQLLVEVDEQPLSVWGCDGVIMSTATGSTAYAFSAGGPVIWPDADVIQLTPIAAHALFARPLVFGMRTQLAIQLRPNSRGRAVLWCDGRRSFHLPQGTRITVQKSDKPVRLARLHDTPFTERLVQKFHLSVEGWRVAPIDAS